MSIDKVIKNMFVFSNCHTYYCVINFGSFYHFFFNLTLLVVFFKANCILGITFSLINTCNFY